MLRTYYFRLSFLGMILLFAACKQNNPQLQDQLFAVQAQLDLANSKLATFKTKPAPALVHCVFFRLKTDLTEAQKNAFTDGLKSLSKISYTNDLFVGHPAETGDSRLKADYNMVLQMSFSSLDDLAKYQQHELHLKVKSEIGSALAAKPFVYDYWRK